MDPMSPPLAPPALARVDVRGATEDLASLLPAPHIVDDTTATDAVRRILAQVRAGGDQALRGLTERFDGVRVDDLRVPSDDLRAALDEIPAALRDALEVAHENILAYHRTQVRPDTRHEREGVVVRELRRPVDRAGLYVPGGRAPLASSVLMTAAPARAAGVPTLVMCSPPGPDGRMAPAVRAAAAIAGVDEVYRVGGAQAVAAMAYGTESIPAVDVIVGPGNRFVAIAERLVAGEGAVGVPSAFTGPSEVAVIADETTPVEFAAIDLVVQAEHGPDGLSYLITWSEDAADSISAEVARLTESSPRRDEIATTLAKGGFCVMVDGPRAGCRRGQRGRRRAPGDPEPRSGIPRAAGSQRRRRLPRTMGPGQRRRLRSRAESRAPHGQVRSVRERVASRRFLQARPRGSRGSGRSGPAGART